MTDEAGEGGDRRAMGRIRPRYIAFFPGKQVRFLDFERGNVLLRIGLNRLRRRVFFRCLAARDPLKNRISPVFECFQYLTRATDPQKGATDPNRVRKRTHFGAQKSLGQSARLNASVDVWVVLAKFALADVVRQREMESPQILCLILRHNFLTSLFLLRQPLDRRNQSVCQGSSHVGLAGHDRDSPYLTPTASCRPRPSPSI